MTSDRVEYFGMFLSDLNGYFLNSVFISYVTQLTPEASLTLLGYFHITKIS